MPAASQPAAKVECINPNTGRRMSIDAGTYRIFSEAISQVLKGNKEPTFTQIVEGVCRHLQQKKIAFNGSVEWYAVTVKNDMQSKGIIEPFTQKGKKLHRLRNA